MVAAVPATAQRTGSDSAPVSNGGIISVAPIAGRGYQLAATLRTLYDDNLLRLPDGQNANGRSKSDFRFSPTVDASIGMPLGRQQFYIGGTFGRDYYARNTDLNRNRYLIGGGVNWRLGAICTGALAGEFNRRQNLLNDAGFQVDNVQENGTYGGSANCRVGPIGVGGTIIHNTTNNLNPSRALFNVSSTSYAPRLTYGSVNFGQFSLGGSYNDVTYPRRTVLGLSGSVPDRIAIYAGRVGYQRSLGTRLSITLGASYNKARPIPRTQVFFVIDPVTGLPVGVTNDRNGYSGVGYDGSLSYTPSPRLSAQLSASRNVTSTPNAGASFVINQAYGANVSYKVGPSITAGLGAAYDIRDYRGGFVSPTEPRLRVSDKSKRIYGSITYSPVKLYDIDLEVAHQSRVSNPSVFNYSGTSVSLTLRVKLGRG